MTSKIVTWIAGPALLLAMAIPDRMIAQEDSVRHEPERRHYKIIDLGTLGGAGTNSSAFQLNQAGWVAGSSNLVSGGPQHAFLWYGRGPLKDLGTLEGAACPGCNSAADGPNTSGEAAVGSETSILDPNGEDFCEYGTGHQCLAAVWKNGKLRALSNLPGGNNANAFNLNDGGQVIGFAENGIADSCLDQGTHQVIQFEAVLWEPNGHVRELQPLPGDTVGFAFGINNSGQVVGASGLCSNTAIPPNPASPHAVLWDRDGTPHDLGNLGGATNAASAINNRGEVDGAASDSNGIVHAFVWTKEAGMQDFGAFPGAVATIAPCCNTINDNGEVVGFAIDPDGSSRALVWEGKVPVDLNTLIRKNSPWYLQAAESVNNSGEIAGIGVINGATHAFVAIPRDRDDDHDR